MEDASPTLQEQVESSARENEINDCPASRSRNNLLLEIEKRRKVSFNIGDSGKDDDAEEDFVMVNSLTTWTDLFVRTFILDQDESEGGDNSEDDLLFFVKPGHPSLTRSLTGYLPKTAATQLSVFRKHSKQLPIGNVDIDWEETLYLNTIMHSFQYALTLAVVSRTGQDEVQILYKLTQPVYASPSFRNMHQDKSAQGEQITYPLIYFSIDGYKDTMNNSVLRDCESLSLELIATDKSDRSSRSVLFSGSIKYHQIYSAIDPFVLASASSSGGGFLLRSKRNDPDKLMNFLKIKSQFGSAELAVKPMYKESSAPATPCDQVESFINIDHSSWQQIEPVRLLLPWYTKLYNYTAKKMLFFFLCRCKSKMKTTKSQGPPSHTERRFSVSDDVNTFSGKIRGWNARRIQKAKSESEGINMTSVGIEEKEIFVQSIGQEMDEESKCDLWQSPGFVQTFFLCKKSRQFHCIPLLTAVTYICVPCEQIIDSLLRSPQQPVLTF